MTGRLPVALIYPVFFLSGAAALVYQVVWVRSLTLIFGGSHLAVTAVLSIFMAGLAVGGYLMGRVADRVARPLRVYGLLELGIAAGALLFMGLMKVYPAAYVTLAQGREEAILYLSGVRVLFSVLALIGPTTLMGGTLPILAHFVARQPAELRSALSLLYGLNTLGAVLGALLAGFVLLPHYPVSTTLHLAVAANAVIGLASILLQGAVPSAAPPGDSVGPEAEKTPARAPSVPGERRDPWPDASVRLVRWGIGISGFCALGYEVLWTRILTIVVGASVYGFTVMLVAFLTGIALGSKAYGATARFPGERDAELRRPVAWFGIVQIIIGASAFLVTASLRDLPANAVRLQSLTRWTGIGSFAVRAWSNFALAFLSMVVPSFFMGVAFPLAGEVQARYRRLVGRGVGEVLAVNTVGAILGAGVSGFGMIYLFGIERSLQMLSVLNVGLGLLVLASLRRRRWLHAVVAAGTLGTILFLAVNQTAARLWDMHYFAIFRNNQPEAFRTPAMVREAVENTDVLYYGEGIESIVSAIKVKGGEQSFITNGRIEASTHLQAQQCQLTLGHLPMLLSREPRRVLVVGLGSGMTLGATSVHPGGERLTLVEIEPKVLGVARTFAAYNHRVLDNPKLRIVFNDGRNFLLTTPETFDVITADPIHPWFRGAGYLYTTEYFGLAARHLRPGGVIAQWLPIYELTPRDLQSVVRTFRQQFRYTLMWLTHYDAELVGSNDPLRIDEAELERRIAEPAVAGDLRKVMMGSAADFLSYFLMGSEGMARFSRDGILNTDDNLYLEFSAPFSIATPTVMEANVNALAAYRESLLPYLVPAAEGRALEAQRTRWALQREAGGIGDPALALYLGGKAGRPEFTRLLDEMDRRYPWYAPGQFLKHEYQETLALAPRPLQRVALRLANEAGGQTVVEITAVLVPVSRSRAALMFVDHRARVVYGQVYVDGYDQGNSVQRLTNEVLTAIQAAYQKEAEISLAQRKMLPPVSDTLQQIRGVIGSQLRGAGARE